MEYVLDFCGRAGAARGYAPMLTVRNNGVLGRSLVEDQLCIELCMINARIQTRLARLNALHYPQISKINHRHFIPSN